MDAGKIVGRFAVCLVLFLVFCTPLVGAVSLEVHSKGVNLGRGWFDDDQDYWNQSNDEFNVFTVTEQADDGCDYVALFCPKAYISEGAGLVRIAKVNSSSYDIRDACVAADGRLWVAMNTGLYRSLSTWGTTTKWVNDTDYFMQIDSGGYDRLRPTREDVYALSGNNIKSIDFDTYSPTTLYTISYGSVKDIYIDDLDNVWAIAMWTEDGSEPRKIYKNGVNVFNAASASNEDGGGSLHVDEDENAYWSGWHASGKYQVHNSSGYVKDWYDSGVNKYPIYKGSAVFGLYNNLGLLCYNTDCNGGGTWSLVTFTTGFTQPNYVANPFTEDANITGIIYSPHSQYYKNQDFTIAYRIAYHFTEWFVSAVGGYESGVKADAYSDLMNRYRFSVELSYNGTQIGTYTCPTDFGSWSGENYNETCGFGGIFDCVNTIDLIQRKYLTFTPDGELWEDSGTYTARLLITNKTTLEQYTLASDTFTVLNQTYNESTGQLPPEEEIPDDAGEPEAIYNNLLYFMTLPIFWGLIIYAGLVSGLAQAGVNGAAIGLIAFLLLQLFAVVGLFAPYTIYILVVSWIGAGMFFMIGRRMISSGGGEY